MSKRLTDEDYIEIRKRVVDARKLPFVTWGCSKLIEGDVPALLEEVELLNSEIADREKSHIDLYCENKELKETTKNLRTMLEKLEISVIKHCDENSEPFKTATSNGDDSYTPIEDLDLTVRSYNVFKRHGINDVESLIKITKAELSEIKNINEKVIQETRDRLSEYGLDLNMSTIYNESCKNRDI
jgi:DNA-directed RNA polymerase alpha subunit